MKKENIISFIRNELLNTKSKLILTRPNTSEINNRIDKLVEAIKVLDYINVMDDTCWND